jgi:hypothetical protein
VFAILRLRATCGNKRLRNGDQRKKFQNVQITIREKYGGRWKISFQAFIRDPEHMDIIDIPSHLTGRKSPDGL